MQRLTDEFVWNDNGKRGHLALSPGGAFYFITADLPPIDVPRGAALLCHLSNKQIIEHGAGVPCRERRFSPQAAAEAAGEK
jgi:hypothetical protein